MTQGQVYDKVIEGLKERVPITTTLKKLDYTRTKFYKLLTNEEKKEILFHKALTSRQSPKGYDIPDGGSKLLNEVEEYFKEEEYNY